MSRNPFDFADVAEPEPRPRPRKPPLPGWFVAMLILGVVLPLLAVGYVLALAAGSWLGQEIRQPRATTATR